MRRFNVSHTIPRLALIFRLPSGFFPAYGATVVRGGRADRENHTTRGGDEIDSRCDARDENAGRERRNARRDRRAGEKRGRSSCQIIERCAPLSFAVRCKKFRFPVRRICVFEEYVPRSSTSNEAPEDNEMSRRKEFSRG